MPWNCHNQSLGDLDTVFKDCEPFKTPPGLLFHTFWAGPIQRVHLLQIDTFLATQTLNNCSKFIFWVSSPEHIPAATHRRELAQFYEIRHFDLARESSGTCLTHKKELWNSTYSTELGVDIAALSDLLRLLLLHNYGGVWIDSDTFLLKDFLPLVRWYGAFAPFIGMWNNHVLFLGANPRNHITDRMLSAVCYELPFDHALWRQNWEFDNKPGWVWNDGMLDLCAQYDCGINKLSMHLVDPDWTCSGMHEECSPMPVEFIFPRLHNAYAWHTRHLKGGNSSQLCIDAPETSQLGPMIRKMRHLFAQGDVLEGHSIFPAQDINGQRERGPLARLFPTEAKSGLSGCSAVKWSSRDRFRPCSRDSSDGMCIC